MKSNVATFTLTAIVCLLGAPAAAAAQQPHAQALSARANPSPTVSTPLLTPIDQYRYVSADAYCAAFGLGGDYFEATDFGPFGAGASANAGCAYAQALQQSDILENKIVASGSVLAYTWFGDVTDFSSSTSYLDVRFSVATPVNYRATGSGAASVELRDDSASLFDSTFFGQLEEVGVLTPGEYVFQVSAQAWDSESSFDVTFDIEDCDADARPPTLSYPPTVIVVDDWRSPGEFAVFSVTATDICDPVPSVVCVPPSGSFFPRGTTIVTCTATDSSGNQSVGTFPVVVQPTVERRRL